MLQIAFRSIRKCNDSIFYILYSFDRKICIVQKSQKGSSKKDYPSIRLHFARNRSFQFDHDLRNFWNRAAAPVCPISSNFVTRPPSVGAPNYVIRCARLLVCSSASLVAPLVLRTVTGTRLGSPSCSSISPPPLPDLFPFARGREGRLP